MGRRVLLISPAKKGAELVDRLHHGLSLIAGILVSAGHQVRVFDFAFLKSLNPRINCPSIRAIIDEFRPEVIGISVFTYLFDECVDLIEEIHICSRAPIILGGPHFSVFPDDFRSNSGVSYIVQGEAEKIILDLVENASAQQAPVFINAPLPLPEDIPAVNLDVAYGSEFLSNYQIQLSRGCPFKCAFCNIKYVSGPKPRLRDIDTCLTQISQAKKTYPNLKAVTITDDCPNLNKEYFKKFLLKFKELGTGCELFVTNLRADCIDAEMIRIYKMAGGKNICLGVESGSLEVFNFINKGESLDKIVSAARLVRSYGLELGLCFVIGLPQDNPQRHLSSMNLAKILRPNYIFWNMCLPWPGTEVHKWFEHHGRLFELRNFSTLIGPYLNFDQPPCESPDFSRKQRIKSWLTANLEIGHSFKGFWKLPWLAFKYNIFKSVFIYCFNGIYFQCSPPIFYLRILVVSFFSLAYAWIIKLPGIKFDLYVRGLAIRAISKNFSIITLRTLLHPIDNLEYFEFDFASRNLNSIPAGRLIDIYSSAAFPLWAADRKKYHVTVVKNGRLEYFDQTHGISADKARIRLVKISDYTNLPFPDNSFDALTFFNAFNQRGGRDEEAALNEFIRIVRPKGRIIITLPVGKEYAQEYNLFNFYGREKYSFESQDCFLRRFYDDKTLSSKIVSNQKIRLLQKEYFVEASPGCFSDYLCTRTEHRSFAKRLMVMAKEPWLLPRLMSGPVFDHPNDRVGSCHLAFEVMK